MSLIGSPMSSISDGIKGYTIAEFASAMALMEIANATKPSAEMGQKEEK
ncbi:hypothetical protein ACFIOY_40100 [Bradyrhizobium sp. TZ2]